MSGSDNQSSTLQSYIDAASSTVQSAIGSVTGNPADKREADKKQAESDAKDSLSHAGGSAFGYSASAEGVTKNDPRRQEGSWNQTVGSGKEFIGSVLGHEGLKRDGAEQNAAGKGQEAAGQLSDLGQGVSDRITGTVGAGIASLTGNKDAAQSYQDQHDAGKTRQRGAESDIQKQAPQE